MPEAPPHLPEGEEHDCLDAQELGQGPYGLQLVFEGLVEHHQAVERPHLGVGVGWVGVGG